MEVISPKEVPTFKYITSFKLRFSFLKRFLTKATGEGMIITTKLLLQNIKKRLELGVLL